jgi:threonine/homoserine/homoserine lactone efflux protein
MDSFLFLRGFAIGLALAAPVGPVGVLCIRRALSHARMSAFLSSMGAALGDTVLGSIAGFGISYVSSFLESEQTLIRIVGGIFLIAIGIRTFRMHGDDQSQSANTPSSVLKDFISTFIITITNPATLLSAFGVFAALGGAITPSDRAAAWKLVLGMFGGSTIWWLVLSAVAGSVRARMKSIRLDIVNRAAGLVLIGFGVVILVGVVVKHFGFTALSL